MVRIAAHKSRTKYSDKKAHHRIDARNFNKNGVIDRETEREREKRRAIRRVQGYGQRLREYAINCLATSWSTCRVIEESAVKFEGSSSDSLSIDDEPSRSNTDIPRRECMDTGVAAQYFKKIFLEICCRADGSLSDL